jgi:hypothetical protein
MHVKLNVFFATPFKKRCVLAQPFLKVVYIMETDIVTNMPSPANTSNISASASSNNMWKYIIIFLILALLGFNLFTYFGQLSHFLGSVVNRILNTFRPILAYFGYGIGEVAKKTVNVTAGAVTGGIDVLEKGLKKPPVKNYKKDLKPQKHPLPADADNLTRKAGFCYIGEDRGFRSCISVGEGDDCMSQDIYPTMDQCINPNLRSG